MKKKFALVLVGCIVLLGTGCGNTEKKMTCSRTMDQNGMKAELKYEVTYSKDTVKRIKSTETITSDSEVTLNAYKKSVEQIYSPYKDLEHYKYSVTVDGDKLTSIADINYEKVDTDKMIKIDSANSQLIKNGKVSLKDIKSAYESVGATCKE